MKTEIKNVVAFITGGASGIGKAVAEMIVDNGGYVSLVDIDDKTGKEVAKQLGSRALYLHADVLSEDEIREALKATKSKFGKINVLINSAAILGGEHFYDYETNTPHPLQSCREIMEVNTIGVFNVMRLATSIMMEAPCDDDDQRGVIINLSSIAGYGVTDRIVYGASKAAVNAMTEPVARWLAPVGIRVVGIAPGVVDTPMIACWTKEVMTKMINGGMTPKRIGHPTEIAHIIKCVIENHYINAENIRIDTGFRSNNACVPLKHSVAA